ncbi:hypothetical protein [Neorhodopirellula pilleata]|uniref:Nucleotidyltransferase n=1 Tax=Neorhodopirellula pilleata TaxID=2714738 RepID=A0A5C6AAC1_9BACT|nr:hypothetical protein [Neorhodopirellula pilleata]TWT96258.1 hypothetical protein Pla100_27350 [Neorhodopirellula pilleata]
MDLDLSDLIDAASRLQHEWTQLGLQFCFIGGLAVHRWGQPRQTDDVHATVWTEFGNERPVIDTLMRHLTGRIAEVEQFAIQNRVLLCQESRGVDVDVSLAAFPFELDLIQRSTLENFREIGLQVCGPSDLIILKAFANRPHDWTDIRGVIVRSGPQLDWTLIDQELRVLAELKEEPEILSKLQELRDSPIATRSER